MSLDLMQLLEYNKMCAKFLSADNDLLCYYLPKFGLYKNSYGEIYYEDVFKEDELKFHLDWNWIMEILNKISLLDFGWKVTSKYVNIYSHAGDPRGEFDCKFEINCPQNVIIDVIKTINQFLIWYNNETKTN